MNAHKVCMRMKMRYILVEQFSYTLFCYFLEVEAHMVWSEVKWMAPLSFYILRLRAVPQITVVPDTY